MEKFNVEAKSFYVPSVSAMTGEVSFIFNRGIAAFWKGKEASDVLKDLGVSSRSFDGSSLSDILHQAAKHYFVKLCDEVTANFAAGTLAKCVYQEKWMRHSFYYAVDTIPEEFNNQWAVTVVANCLKEINFDHARREIMESCFTLKSKGIADQAHALCSFFWIAPKRNWGKTPYAKGDMVICQTSTAYYNSSTYNKSFTDVQNALAMVSEMTGANFGSGYPALMEAIKGLHYNQQSIPSRTNFGKGEALQIVCFNDKYEFRFTKKAFSALMAFILSNATGERLEDAQAFLDSDWATPVAKRA